MGQKHVSWHHSLFPTEHVLRVKPSLPSLSSIAAESAEATLSQLPSVPVMARDNVAAFHQSIRSLRTLSRIEIAKMSYKQQGRQALASPAPIPKSPSDLLPWWSPSRWIKGTVEVDKRHWKPDDSRESCAFCFAPFHRLTNPRHHCRKCGDLFCGKCANAEILMDAKNCVYVQQSQLARWSRRVDLQRHSVWIDTLPQLHPVRTAAESALVAGTDGHGSIGHNGGAGAGIGVIGGVGMSQRSFSGNGGGGGRGSWQVGSGVSKRSRISIFALFGNGVPASGASNPPSDSRRSSVDFASAETVYSNHYGRLQPHSQNPLAVTFAAGRRSSSSSILRSTSVGVPNPLMIIGTPLGSSESGLPPIAMSRGMSSGGVGEVCLARICVGCERELLKPVPRCTSIAKYYGSLNSRHGYRPPLHGYSNLGPRAGRQHQGPQAGPLHPMDDDPTYTASHEHPVNGGRRHSPLRQTSHIDNIPAHEEHGHPMSHSRQGNYDEGARIGPDHNYGAVAQGELGYAPGVLTFQEQQLQYTQQTLGPIPRELC
ncbi:hypothetical protein BGZ98_004455 [Dissophora globulifera]|nr:hypothetical protein BGZ98_004455 [Dissophora globulifera]